MIGGAGFTDIEFGPLVDTYAGAEGEKKARLFGTYGYPFHGRKPG